MFKAPWLPWVLMGFSFLMHGNIPKDEICGVLVGHVWYYFNDIYPPTHGGHRPMDPPQWWINLFEGNIFGRANANEAEDVAEDERIVRLALKPHELGRDRVEAVVRLGQEVAQQLVHTPHTRSERRGKPRLSVFRSSKQIYCQVIDDAAGRTLAAASSMEKDQREGLKTGANIAAAGAIGKLIAERAKAAGVAEVVFDRGGYMYHGRVKALAEGAREGGLKF